jgi:hypothetical protein
VALEEVVGRCGGSALHGNCQFTHGQRLAKHEKRRGAQRAENQGQRAIHRGLRSRAGPGDRVGDVAHVRAFEADRQLMALRDHRQQNQASAAEGDGAVVRKGDTEHPVGVGDPRLQVIEQRGRAVAHHRGPDPPYLAVNSVPAARHRGSITAQASSDASVPPRRRESH